MIKIILKNEALDVNPDTVITFKKSQQLNGIQDLYSFSNNFGLIDSSKNRRLLGINYLPNSKAKSMTAGYDVDVVLNGCIFLKKQKLKVQKESKGSIPVYLIFTDNFFVAKAKATLMSQIDTGVVYTKELGYFIAQNLVTESARTAPISAQDTSGLIVVEEIPILLNIKDLVLKIFTQLGYAYTGDILTDENIGAYYTNSNVGVYGPDGTPIFDKTKTVYDFILDFLKTFNGYIEVSDSSKSIGLYFWKNIETIKQNFVDYSAKFTGFEEYTFEGGLAKINTVSYSDSPDFYNGFFDNNKSIVEKTEYLKSGFGAGNLRLFADQDLEEDGTLLPRTNGEIAEPQTMNIYRFEETTTSTPVYFGGVLSYVDLYKAFSPNILEIWQTFHRAYCDNIALPTIAQLNFRYDALFLSEFKMGQVFYLKQLATYWLPMELNYSTKKEGVKIKSIMIEKTRADVPVVFDQNLSVDFYGEVFILDIFALYAAFNVSPAATMLIVGADLTKNNIFVNGVQVLAFPTSIGVHGPFELRVENIEPVNVKSNSDILFQFVSDQGGISRVAKINVAHNGRANFVSEFRSEHDTLYSYGQNDVDGFTRYLNYSAKITTPINIVDTLAPQIGDISAVIFVGIPRPPVEFNALDFDRASTVMAQLTVEYLRLKVSNRGGGAEARTKIYFRLFKNGVFLKDVHTAAAIDSKKSGDTTIEYLNVNKSTTFNVLAGDIIAMAVYINGSEEDRIGSGTMDGSVALKNINWKFLVTEQL